jgi:penicillin V acylase-like amidase (Ntn superfamily)
MKFPNNPLQLTVVVLGFMAVPFQVSQACTTVAFPKSVDKVVAKSYDWHQGHGMVVANLKGISKKSLSLKPDDVSTEWVSQFGSVTFNQNGREFPLGGMNEKGLVLEIMWLDGTIYPEADARPSVNELQWIQYQLDNYSTVAQVVADADKIRVSQAYADVHYMACDASGACATFEYWGGKLVVTEGADLKASALTNGTYQDSMKYLANFDGFGGRAPLPTGPSSNQRFVRATMLAGAYDPKGKVDASDAAFKTLDSVGGTAYSKFHIVYNPTSKTIQFRTHAKRAIKTIDMKGWDYSCAKDKDRTLIWDMDTSTPAGDITAKFKPYSEKENLRMVKRGIKDIEGSLPPKMAERLAAYPASLPCR